MGSSFFSLSRIDFGLWGPEEAKEPCAGKLLRLIQDPFGDGESCKNYVG